MRAMDWRGFLTAQRIAFIERGPNVKRGEINCQCPFCGTADPSMHLGFNLTTGWYSCWRNRAAHSGKSPVRLVMKLLRCSYAQAREACGLGESFVDPEGFDAVAARMLGRLDVVGRPEQLKRREFLELDRGWRTITDDVLTRRFWNYLYNRGFDDPSQLSTDYTLLAARSGEQAARVVFPYFVDQRVVTWTGRAIGPAAIRYRDLDIKDALIPVKETLYNVDCIHGGGKLLAVVEGPVDTLKIDFYGKAEGVRAVGLSTNTLSMSQSFMLEDARGKFERIGVMADNKTATAAVDNMRLRQQLAFLGPVVALQPPGNRGDAGEATPGEVLTWVTQQTRTARK